jgi:hypothetical protein
MFAGVELTATETGRAAKAILDSITAELPGYRWESLCAYSDGKSKTVLELSLYRKNGSELVVSIGYHVETGEMMTHRYPGYEGEAPENIIDLLLDTHNHERMRVARMQAGARKGSGFTA